MSKVIVIGGGASGIVSAILSARCGNEVTVLEHNNVCGKKILITGNGKCNYWNSDQDISHYHSNNMSELEIILSLSRDKVLEFFDSIGIIPKIKNGYYYPYSNLSASISYALMKEATNLGITFIYNVNVTNIEKYYDTFKITSNAAIFSSDKVILATGSKAFSKTGSDGSGYNLASKLGHTLVDVYPSLVPLKMNEPYLKKWSGIRTDALVSLYIDNTLIKSEQGELQLTDYGLSGICIFNLSRFVAQAINNKQNVAVHINFVPWYDKDKSTFIDFMNEQNKKLNHRTIHEILEGFLHYKLVDVILKNMHINENIAWNDLTTIEKAALIENLCSFKVNVVGTNDFDKAQVCKGGVKLSEINPKTMESKLIRGLYIIGELLDVDGDCGGYNLGFAWMSGILAGSDTIND